MKPALKFATPSHVLLFFFALLIQAPSNASESFGPCDTSGGQRPELSERECQIIANQAAGERSVVYRDAHVTVLAVRAEVSRKGDLVEAGLVYDYAQATSAAREATGPRSQLRRLRFDCAKNLSAVQESSYYARPVARGDAAKITRTPDAPMRPLDKASIDARIAAALCAMVKE